MTMKRLFALLLFVVLTPAQAAWLCLPSPPSPLGPYQDTARIVKEPSGNIVVAWWCSTTDVATNVTTTKMEQFRVLSKYVDTAKLGAATARVLLSNDPVDTANAEITAAQVAPEVGSVDEYDMRRLTYVGCMELVKTTPPEIFVPPLTDAFCGVAPTPPVAPTEIWLTSGRTVYASSAGKLAAFQGITTLGLTCNCAKPIVVGTLTYCTFVGAALTTNVAQCKRQ
jgi:hypothetical protein